MAVAGLTSARRGLTRDGVLMSAAPRLAECADVCPRETAPSSEDRARIDAARLEMRLADLQRWGALLADECERFADESRTRTVTADMACGLADCASDAVIDACARVNAARRALRVFDARREINDAALRAGAGRVR